MLESLLDKVATTTLSKKEISSSCFPVKLQNPCKISKSAIFTEGSFIKRQMSGTSSDNERQQMTASGTTNDIEWYNK